jgi:hypothetical protein
VERVRFCQCRHGKDAHRNGEGYCLGERKIRTRERDPATPDASEQVDERADARERSIRYVDCECQLFVERDPNAPKGRRR